MKEQFRNKNIVKKHIAVLMIILFMACTFSFSADAGSVVITSKSQLNSPDIKVGAGTGSAAMLAVEEEFPDAELVYLELNEGLEALSLGKIDAYVYGLRQMKLALESGKKGLKLLDEYMDTKVHIAVGLSPVSKVEGLEDKINAFIDEIRKDGTLDDMYRRWVIDNADKMPEIEPASAPSFTLVVGTTGIVPPYSYYKSDQLYGYDIELAYRFAAYLNASVEFKVYDYGSIIPAAATGDVDCIMANLNITPERAQALPFSEDLFTETLGIMVRDDTQITSAYDSEGRPEFESFDQLSGKKVSMLTGAPFEDLVSSFVPDVGSFTYYNNMPDMILGLKTGKTDAFLNNNALATLAVNKNPELALFPQSLKDGMFGIAFNKDDDSRGKWQEAFDSIPKETIDELWNKWTGADENVKQPTIQDWPGSNGEVTVACCDSLEPMSYIGNSGQIMGFDIDIILLMAKELDMHVEFIPMEFAAELSYVQLGKALMGVGSIIVTDERKEAVDFIEYYPASFVLVVRKASTSGGSASFWADIRSSFEKTFIRENRWKLFANGVLTTLEITILSIIFGTAFGFVIFMLCRKDNKYANSITNACIKIVQGMPMVVLLMVLYYIIFGKVSVSGIIVSVIGFTMTFAASVYGLLKIGVSAVDKGQYEAAYALGYPDHKIFFKIILPQALPHVISAYKSSIVELIKATAVVGYIAVQDLTKIGDIVRSRTYDAFFPLIAIAVIYFALEWFIGLIISRIEIGTDREKRKTKGVLKNVKMHE